MWQGEVFAISDCLVFMVSMLFHAFPSRWNAMEFHGMSWNSMDCHGRYVGMPWLPWKWSLLDTYGSNPPVNVVPST